MFSLQWNTIDNKIYPPTYKFKYREEFFMEKLRPSCQEDYVELVMKAEDPQIRERTIQRILKMTAGYFQRHPEKYENSQRKN
jgi:hypothetical protein